MPVVSSLVKEYIQIHPSILDGLRKRVINYSALARLIKKDLKLHSSITHNALVIAIQRYSEKEITVFYEEQIRQLFLQSEVEVKNKITRYTFKKQVNHEKLIGIDQSIKKANDFIITIEGSKSVTVIVQDKNQPLFQPISHKHIIQQEHDLCLVIVKSPGIEKIKGAISFLTGIFYANNVNIKELLSCWEESIFLIDKKDVQTVMRFMSF